MTLRIVALAASYIAGIGLATWLRTPASSWALLAVSATGGCVTVWIFLRERRWREHARIVVALAALGWGLPFGYWRASQKSAPPAPGTLAHALGAAPADAWLGLRGVISAEPDYIEQGKGDLVIRVRAIRAGPAGPWEEVTPAEVLLRVTAGGAKGDDDIGLFNRLMHPGAYGFTVEAEARRPARRRPLNPGEFDFEAFLAQSDVVARLSATAGRVKVLERTRGNLLLETALAAKERFLVVFKETIRSPASRLAAGAGLGVRRAVERQAFRDTEITEMFRHSGVGHVLAVSGLHVSIISVLLYALFQFSGLRPRAYAPPMILFLVLFAMLTGSRPSSVRAVIMNSVVIVAYSYFHMGARRATQVGLALSSLALLVYNPLLLYAPSFLLSFGAVLSLVAITPVIDPWIRQLRGFSLVLALAWFGGLLWLCSVNLDALRSPSSLAALAGALWLLLAAGGRLNDAFPRAGAAGLLGRLSGLRLFASAQLAIQLGMMVPMSALFFGRFPVAGVLVNMLAIPAIGVMVQLSMLVGLFGLVPLAGRWLAMPLGAATTLTGDFFYWMVYAGTKLFRFPAAPRPGLGWLAAYYAALVLVLAALSARWRLQALAGRAWPWLKRRPLALACARCAPLLLLAAPALDLAADRGTNLRSVLCLATRRYPLVTAVSDRGTAVTVNAGDRFTGGSLLFDVLRSQGATRVEAAAVAGPDPALGHEGLASLAAKMLVRRCFLPVVAGTPGGYLEALGDRYLSDMAAKGEGWARRYADAYGGLVSALGARGVAPEPLGRAAETGWTEFSLGALPGPSKPPRRFASRARTAVVRMRTEGFRWLVVSDSTPDALGVALGDAAGPCDVLVLPDPGARKGMLEVIDAAVDLARPAVVILSGADAPPAFDARAWGRERGAAYVFSTAADGAVIAVFPEGGGMQLRGFASGRCANLRRPARAPAPPPGAAPPGGAALPTRPAAPAGRSAPGP